MSFSSFSKKNELEALVKVLDCFGVAEERQVRSLFSHLPDDKYGALLSRACREGLALRSSDRLCLRSAHHKVERSERSCRIRAFSVFIRLSKYLTDFSAGTYPTVCSVSTDENVYDIICLEKDTVDAINEQFEQLGESDIRLISTLSAQLLAQLLIRKFTDYAVLVAPDGLTTILRAGGDE